MRSAYFKIILDEKNSGGRLFQSVIVWENEHLKVLVRDEIGANLAEWSCQLERVDYSGITADVSSPKFSCAKQQQKKPGCFPSRF